MTEEQTQRHLKELVQRIDDLPTLPSVITRIIRMVEDPETTASDMHTVISQDPSLTGKVLKLVNSAFYGFSRQISTVREAVVILGFNRVKSLALSASVFEVFQGPGVEKFDRVGLWEHSIATGIAGEIVGKRLEHENPEEVLVAGILHNIGKIVIDLYFHSELKEIFRIVLQKDCLMLEAEREVLGVGHDEIGAWLSDQWNLPEKITAALRYYHHPFDAPDEHQLLPMLIHTGDILARSKNRGWTGDSTMPEFREDVKEKLDLTPDAIPEILDRMESEMRDARVFLELSETNGESDHG